MRGTNEILYQTIHLLVLAVLPLVIAGCGSAAKQPWSGNWWPMVKGPTNLYASNGPLDKYDQYVQAKYGYNPQAKKWEADAVRGVVYATNPNTSISGNIPAWMLKTGPPNPHAFYGYQLDENVMESVLNYDANGDGVKDDSWDINLDGQLTNLSPTGLGWFGHCNGWAAASVFEDEPTKPLTKEGITFSVGDLKGLLTEAHNRDPVLFLIGNPGSGGISAVDFHNIMQNFLGLKITSTDPFELKGEKEQAIIMDKFLDPSPSQKQVWNHPISAYLLGFTPDPVVPDKWYIKIQVKYVSDSVPPDYVGSDLKDIFYEYCLLGSLSSPTSGNWEGTSVQNHPDFLWRPKSATPGNPKLDYAIVKEIVK